MLDLFGKLFAPKAMPEDDLNPARATEFFGRGDFKEALRRADVILAAGPKIGLSWRFKGECLFQMNRFADAETCFRRAHQVGGAGTDEVLFWAAFCQHNLGQRDGALSTLQEHIKSLPPHDAERRRQAERAMEAFRKG